MISFWSFYWQRVCSQHAVWPYGVFLHSETNKRRKTFTVLEYEVVFASEKTLHMFALLVSWAH